MALYTADRFPPHPDIANGFWRRVSYIEQVVGSRDLYTGRVLV